MGLFKAIGGALSAAIDVAILPVDMAKDVITMGGTLTDDDSSATGERIQKVYDQLKQACEDLGE